MLALLTVACAAEEEPPVSVQGLPGSLEHPIRVERFVQEGTASEFFLRAPAVPWTLSVDVVDPEGVTFEFDVCLEPPDDECDVVSVPASNSVVFLEWTPPTEAEVVVWYRDASVLEPPPQIPIY